MTTTHPIAAVLGKVIGFGFLAGLAVTVAPLLIARRNWIALAVLVAVVAGLVAVYATRRAVPAKFLAPGVLLLATFLVYPIALTIHTSTTNYGDGTRTAKAQSVASMIAATSVRVPGSPTYPLAVGTTDSDTTGPFTYFVLDPDGSVRGGTKTRPLAPVDAAKVTVRDGAITQVDGYALLTAAEIDAISGQGEPLDGFTVPAGNGSQLRAQGLSAVLVRPVLTWDKARDVITDERTGDRYTPLRTATGDRSYYTDADGNRLPQSWLENVGGANYRQIATDPQVNNDLMGILVWTIAFALLTVTSQFALGIALAVSLDDRRIRLQRFWRSFLLLPYAIPGFISILLWSSFWNQDFGLVNSLTHLHVNWLGTVATARAAVLATNLWLGFPYMYLISTGVLQSIPRELTESAAVDGARGWTRFRRITLPLVLAGVAPLLVASFAVNFNNFNIIQLLTGGGPFSAGNPNAGGTDILISYTYRLAFGNSGSRIGFASAVSVVLFVLTAVMAMLQFRVSRRFEEVY